MNGTLLIGWELGGNRGHAQRIREIRRTALQMGLRVEMALQDITCLGTDDTGGAWQAPLWPMLNRPLRGVPPTMAGVLSGVGAEKAGAVRAVIRAWDRIISAVKPDIIVTDHAPALLMTARGRVPAVATGTGFTLPPCTGDTLPAVLGADSQPGMQERLLERINSEIAAAGAQPITRLPQIFDADERVIATHSELDPYRGMRTEPLCRPTAAGAASEKAGQDDALLIYSHGNISPEAPFWRASSEVFARVDAYIEGCTPGHVRMAEKFGIRLHERPVDLAACDAGRALSHGGLGFVSTMLEAGVPQVIAYYDLEKQCTASAVQQLDAGVALSMAGMNHQSAGAALHALRHDAALKNGARRTSTRIRTRAAEPFGDALGAALSGLLRA